LLKLIEDIGNKRSILTIAGAIFKTK
jgi:hypothetical protein